MSPDDGGEQTFEEVRKLQADIEATRSRSLALFTSLPTSSEQHVEFGYADVLPLLFYHPGLSPKIREACRVSREAGFRLLWLDSCCIDKSSSAELSEAINSMYTWYMHSDICYAYRSDVPDGSNSEAQMLRFRRSRWHERGWTLQELIAPRRLAFLTQSWRFFGTKRGLASTLEDITGVGFDILTGRDGLASVSVARRMSWAARRQTTRVEDRAYSLMGIFGVHMSPIYGEGTNAFLRLQEEIIRTIPDQSIFAWGYSCTLHSFEGESSSSAWHTHSPCLLAQSPSDFWVDREISPLSSDEFAVRVRRKLEDVPSLHCVFTPHGIRIQLLCIELSQIPKALLALDICDDCTELGHAYAFALLQCEDEEGYVLALPLCHPRSTIRTGVTIATHIQCEVGYHRPHRVVFLSPETLCEILDCPSSITKSEVCLLRNLEVPATPKSGRAPFALKHNLNLWPGDRGDGIDFRIAPHCYEELRVLGFDLLPLCVLERSAAQVIVSTCLVSDPDSHLHSGESKLTVQVQLSLTSLQAYNDTMARFSLTTNAIHTPLRTESQFRACHTGVRTLAQAEFIICVDRHPVTLRHLLLTLERPMESSLIADSRSLDISLELSDMHLYETLIAEEDNSSGLLGPEPEESACTDM
ncbi:hypothetical protein BC628DRAFT_509252 [Trametes gibbosa]|nr:hypothetical protein BC628DRAFT_509252 [Trametes gibbosa]